MKSTHPFYICGRWWFNLRRDTCIVVHEIVDVKRQSIRNDDRFIWVVVTR